MKFTALILTVVALASAACVDAKDSHDMSASAVRHREGRSRLRDHDIDVSVFWSSDADVDLRVKEPGRGGCDISYRNPTCDEAFLVEDVIPGGCSDNTGRNEEKIIWPRFTANPGKYRVKVTHYSGSCLDTVMVRVDAKSKGRRVVRKHYTIRRGQTKSFKFTRRDDGTGGGL